MPALPAARQGDIVQAVDTHIVMVPSPGGPVPTPIPGHPFNGIISGGTSSNVTIMGAPAATVNSTAVNQPPHLPIGGPSFQVPPMNQATITMGSTTVLINGRSAARNGDPAQTCDDVNPLPHGRVVAAGSVLIGG